MFAAPFGAASAIVVAVFSAGFLHQEGRNQRRGIGRVDTLAQEIAPVGVVILFVVVAVRIHHPLHRTLVKADRVAEPLAKWFTVIAGPAAKPCNYFCTTEGGVGILYQEGGDQGGQFRIHPCLSGVPGGYCSLHASLHCLPLADALAFSTRRAVIRGVA